MHFLVLVVASAVAYLFMNPNGIVGSPLPRARCKTRAEFVALVRAAASRVNLRGIHFDIMLAVFALETGWGGLVGDSDIFIMTNNLGSIKSTAGWTGKPSYKKTRVYGSLEESIADWVRLIAESVGPSPSRPDYRAAYAAAKAGNYSGAFLGLQAAGYEVSLQGKPYAARLEDSYAALRGVA